MYMLRIQFEVIKINFAKTLIKTKQNSFVINY